MSELVGDVMAPGTIVVGPNETAASVRRIMKLESVHALPVVNAQHALLGLITSTDLLANHPPRQRVSHIMNRDVVTIGPRASVAAAARLMRRKRIHHLVVAHAGKVIGIMSTFDLLRLLEEPASRKNKPSRRK